MTDPAGGRMHTVAARDGTRLAVHERGAGPPLLCVPGGPGRASAYLEDLGGLDATRTLLLLDNRGTGRSELPADRDSLQFPRLADDVEDVRLALGLDTVDVLGHSAGGPVALTFAARYPVALRRLVLVTPSARPFGWTADDVPDIARARSDEPWYADVMAAVNAMQDAPPRVRAELEKATRPLWYGRWDDRAREHAAGADTQMSLRAAAGYWPGEQHDAAAARASLGGIAAPALAVGADRDTLTGVLAAERIAAALPNGTFRLLSRAGHFPWVDDAPAFRAVVEEFLAAG
jgi:pimeloyl-ACP methyl ester carboxylesterase